DLIEMKSRIFDPQDEGKTMHHGEVPPELLDEATAWREMMLEKLYNFSNELMELALAEEPIPVELIRKALREATVARQVQPLLCGSALHGIGVQPVLDAVEYYLPSPADRPPVQGLAPGKKKGEMVPAERKPTPDEPFCGLVFKVLPAK